VALSIPKELWSMLYLLYGRSMISTQVTWPPFGRKVLLLRVYFIAKMKSPKTCSGFLAWRERRWLCRWDVRHASHWSFLWCDFQKKHRRESIRVVLFRDFAMMRIITCDRPLGSSEGVWRRCIALSEMNESTTPYTSFDILKAANYPTAHFHLISPHILNILASM